jgi:DNA-binding NarL/FixJ family response regulator
VIVVETDNIDQAYAIIKKKSADIVFLDIALFPKNCMDHIRFIKQQSPNATIVVLTTHDSAEHKTASLQCGVDYFFSKNNSSSVDLIDIVEKVLEPS